MTAQSHVRIARRLNSEAIQWKRAGFASVARLFRNGREREMQSARATKQERTS